MMKTGLKIVLVIFLAVSLTGFGPCAKITSSEPDRHNPVTLDCWHYHNGEQQANFDRLVETFNRQVGAAQGIVVRAGHHCAQPVMQRLGVPATTRASFAYFNDTADVDALVAGILKVKEIFG